MVFVFQPLPEFVSFRKFKLLAPQKFTSMADGVSVGHGLPLSSETAGCLSWATPRRMSLRYCKRQKPHDQEGSEASNVQNSPVFAASSPEIETDFCPASIRRVISRFNFGFAKSSLSVTTLSSTPTARISA